MKTKNIFAGNRIQFPDGTVEPGSLVCQDGVISSVSRAPSSVSRYDAGDLLMLPGIVDIHGDAFERQIRPRTKSAIPMDIALADTDRQMISSGITTAFHGLTVTWEPGPRDIATARSFFASLERMRPRLSCDTRVHLRHEVLSLDTLDEELSWIREGIVDLVAINDHSHMVERALAHPHGPLDRLETALMDMEEYVALATTAVGRRPEVAASLQRLTAAARDANIPLVSHDDNTPEMRALYHELGCQICEFPADQDTAAAAIRKGDDVVLGGPNIVRGGSHCGRVTAAEMIRQGLCTVICSDYYYPSVLLAPFVLAASGVLPFPAAWDLVSRQPARAARLDDRGILASGMRADLLFVDDSDPLLPVVRAIFVQGVPVFAASLETAGVAALAFS